MRPDVTLYGHWICPFVTRVEFALRQRGIDHDVVDVPPSAVRPTDFVLPREFVAHSPRLEIPMVRVGDEYLADSIPILLWLEEVRSEPSLLPDDRDERTEVIERLHWLDRHLMRPTGAVYYGTDPQRVERAADELARGFGELDQYLGDRDWLAGDEVTLAEAIVVSIYVRLDSLRPLGFTHPLPAGVAAHRRRCEDLASWSAVAWPDERHAEFVARFLKHRELAQRA
ncbi:MAG: glutathione S-transferase family protein [Acidimicrobiia bacterium]|nr:glutathione S-transferase family protein [Acidimicrobiia bacterium]